MLQLNILISTYIKDNSKMGLDFSKYEDEFQAFIQNKFPDGNYYIERDGYLFLCNE